MSKLDSYSDKVMDFVGRVGDNLRGALPDSAGKWLQTGAALGVARTGTRVVGGFVRRNPAVAAAALVGTGVAWYAIHRYRKKREAAAEGGQVIEGRAQRIEARREATSRKSARRIRTNSPD